MTLPIRSVGGLALGLLLSASAFGAVKSGNFELVYTAPVESALNQEEFRSPIEVWPELFDSAKKTIDIAEFYIAPKEGEPLDGVLAALRKAGERGVKIRFLLEKKMLKQSAEGIEILKKIPNLEVRVIEYGKVSEDGIVHAKYMVIDGVRAYVGSHNFDWRSLKHIEETGVAISDPAMVKQMAAIFEVDWKAQLQSEKGKVIPLQKKRPLADGKANAYLVASPWAFNPKGVGDSEAELAKLIDSAREEIVVQVMNYYPLDHRKKQYYPVIDQAIRGAAVRGVKVKLLVADWNTGKPELFHLKSLSLVPNVEIKVITIPQAKEGFIPFARVAHAKYMVVDKKTLWLGTSNWTGGYLDKSRNLEVVLKDATLAGKMAALHEQAWTCPHSAALDLNSDYAKPKKAAKEE